MKKLILALLCLMLVLPLNAYAEGTENQPAKQAEGQTQTGSQTPDQSGSQNSGQTGSQTPDQSGSQNSGQTGSQTPDQSGSQNSGQTGSQTPDQSGSQTPDQSGSQTPDQSGSQNPEQPENQPAETQPSNHTHVWDVSYTVPATCTEEGATAYGCSACGAISVEVLPAAGHKFSSQWTRKAAGHWHACSVCGEQGDFGKHFAGPAATEEQAQICLTCGYTLTPKLGHSHKYGTQWTSDETGHWYACSGCDDQKDFEAHSYGDGCSAECSVCGHKAESSHIYSGTWVSDETGHWDICTICQEKSPVEPHIPGPEATETEAQVCAACNYELAPALTPTEHVHLGEGSWQTDADNHWKTCACGEITDEAAHNWDEGEEQEDTTILYTCEDCGITRMEGEPEDAGGISPLVWIGLAIAVLLGAAIAVLILLIHGLRKGGKYGK